MDKGAEFASQVCGIAHRPVPVADDSLSNESSEVVVVLPTDTFDGEGDVGSRDRVVSDPDLRTDELRLLLLLGGDRGGTRSWRLRGNFSEVLFCEVDKLLMRDATSTNKNHSVGSVVGLDVVRQVVSCDALDVRLGSEDRTAKRLALESRCMKMVEYNFLHLFVDFLLLPQNDIPLSLDGLRVQF